jgi:hypothetical protein
MQEVAKSIGFHYIPQPKVEITMWMCVIILNSNPIEDMKVHSLGHTNLLLSNCTTSQSLYIL